MVRIEICGESRQAVVAQLMEWVEIFAPDTVEQRISIVGQIPSVPPNGPGVNPPAAEEGRKRGRPRKEEAAPVQQAAPTQQAAPAVNAGASTADPMAAMLGMSPQAAPPAQTATKEYTAEEVLATLHDVAKPRAGDNGPLPGYQRVATILGLVGLKNVKEIQAEHRAKIMEACLTS